MCRPVCGWCFSDLLLFLLFLYSARKMHLCRNEFYYYYYAIASSSRNHYSQGRKIFEEHIHEESFLNMWFWKLKSYFVLFYKTWYWGQKGTFPWESGEMCRCSEGKTGEEEECCWNCSVLCCLYFKWQASTAQGKEGWCGHVWIFNRQVLQRFQNSHGSPASRELHRSRRLKMWEEMSLAWALSCPEKSHRCNLPEFNLWSLTNGRNMVVHWVSSIRAHTEGSDAIFEWHFIAVYPKRGFTELKECLD